MRTLILTFLIYSAVSRPILAESSSPPIATNVYSLQDLLTDETGSSHRLNKWAGCQVLLTMAYTTCTRTCPMTVRLLKEIEKQISPSRQCTAVIIVSLDPRGDTPENISEFKSRYGITSPDWHYLRASAKTTSELSKFLGVDQFYLSEHLAHKLKIWWLAPGGELKRVFDWENRKVNKAAPSKEQG